MCDFAVWPPYCTVLPTVLSTVLGTEDNPGDHVLGTAASDMQALFDVNQPLASDLTAPPPPWV